MQNADEGALRRSLARLGAELEQVASVSAIAPPITPGSPLVLLHPFSMCADVWRPVLPLLTREHEVFALNIPGHLGGDPLPERFVHSVETGVDLLEAKLDALGIRQAHIVGNSLGGWFAIELARRQRALSVVAMAPGGGWEMGSRAHRRLLRRMQLARVMVNFGGPAAGILGRYSLLRRLTLGYTVARPELLTPHDARMFIHAAWRCTSFNGVVSCMATQALEEPLHLPCPVRFVWGSADRVLPMRDYAERWRRALPQADWVVLPDVGHVQMHDDPEGVARSILEITCASGHAHVAAAG
ncbi:MAG: alpha/beta hydrolase [Myxococcales bacterium]